MKLETSMRLRVCDGYAILRTLVALPLLLAVHTLTAAEGEGVWQLFPTEGSKRLPSVVLQIRSQHAELVSVSYTSHGSQIIADRFPFQDGAGTGEHSQLSFDGSKGSLRLGELTVPVDGIPLVKTAEPTLISLYFEGLSEITGGQFNGSKIGALLLGDLTDNTVQVVMPRAAVSKPSYDSYQGNEKQAARYATSFGSIVSSVNLQKDYKFMVKSFNSSVESFRVSGNVHVEGDHPGTYAFTATRYGDELLGEWSQGDRTGLLFGHVGTGPRDTLHPLPDMTVEEVPLPGVVDNSPFEPLAQPIADHLGITGMTPFISRERYVTHFIRPIITDARGAQKAEVVRIRHNKKHLIAEVKAENGRFDFSAIWETIPLHVSYTVLIDGEAAFSLNRRPAFSKPMRIEPEAMLARLPSAYNFLQHGSSCSIFNTVFMKELASAGGKKSGPNVTNVGQSIVRAAIMQPNPMRMQQAIRTAEWVVSDQIKAGGWPTPYKTEGYLGLTAGLAYLDLYQHTGQDRWRSMAISIADYAAKMQLEHGGFNWFSPLNGGKWNGNYPYGRGNYVRRKADKATGWLHTGAYDYAFFYGRLRQVLQTEAYVEVERKAVAFMQERNFKTLTWFNRRDTKGRTASSAFDAYSAMVAVEYLLTLNPIGIERAMAVSLANDILKRVEDSAVNWDNPAVVGMMYSAVAYSHGGPGANTSLQFAYLLLLLNQIEADPMKVAKAETLIARVLTAKPDFTNAIGAYVDDKPFSGAVSCLPLRGWTIEYLLRCHELLAAP